MPAFKKELELAYGENPHQRAAYYSERGARRHLLSTVEQLHGRELSFNNLNDLSAARLVVARVRAAGLRDRQAREPVRRRGRRLDRAGVRAGARRRPALGVRRRRRAQPAGERGARRAARGSSSSRCSSRPATTRPRSSCCGRSRRRESSTTASGGRDIRGERDYKRVLGGLLVQERDSDIEDRDGMEVVCGAPSEMAWGDLLFAWRVCKHVTSNAIVLANDLQTIGIGAGQMSRVDSVRIALEKAREHGHELAGAVLASDAFFPFADGPQARARRRRERRSSSRAARSATAR